MIDPSVILGANIRKRPYKAAFDHPKTVEIITKGDDRTMPGHFDPTILEAFRQSHTIFRDIYEEHATLPVA